MNARLNHAKQYLTIAANVDGGDWRKAKLAAYRAAADEIAAAMDEDPDLAQNIVGSIIGCSQGRVSELLKWRQGGYKGVPDPGGPARGRRSEERVAARALKAPASRRAVIESLTGDEAADLIETAAASRPEAIEQAVARPEARKVIERAVEDEQERQIKEAVARSERARHASEQARAPRPLSAHFWRIVTETGKWTRALREIRSELSTLTEDEQAKVAERYIALRNECEEGLRILGEERGELEEYEVIEGMAAAR